MLFYLKSFFEFLDQRTKIRSFKQEKKKRKPQTRWPPRAWLTGKWRKGDWSDARLLRSSGLPLWLGAISMEITKLLYMGTTWSNRPHEVPSLRTSLAGWVPVMLCWCLERCTTMWVVHYVSIHLRESRRPLISYQSRM